MTSDCRVIHVQVLFRLVLFRLLDRSAITPISLTNSGAAELPVFWRRNFWKWVIVEAQPHHLISHRIYRRVEKYPVRTTRRRQESKYLVHVKAKDWR